MYEESSHKYGLDTWKVWLTITPKWNSTKMKKHTLPIFDFDIASRVADSASCTKCKKGTLNFNSPEAMEA